MTALDWVTHGHNFQSAWLQFADHYLDDILCGNHHSWEECPMIGWLVRLVSQLLVTVSLCQNHLLVHDLMSLFSLFREI